MSHLRLARLARLARLGAAALLALLAPAAALSAQQPTQPPAGGMAAMPGMGGDHAAMMARMDSARFQGITLTDAQRARIRDIDARHMQEMQAFREAHHGAARGDTAVARQHRELMQRHQADVRAVLTPDQQAVFDRNEAAMREQMRAHMHEHMGGGMGHGTGHDMGAMHGDAARDSTRHPR